MSDVIISKKITPKRHTVVNIVSSFEDYNLKRVAVNPMIEYTEMYVA